MCHNDRNISLELERKRIEQAAKLGYSPEASPCDFGRFGFLKEQPKEQGPSTLKETIEAITAA
jgi:hypothetical protein